MKLVPKLSLVLVGAMSLVLVVRATSRVRDDKALYEKDTRRDHAVTAHVLRTSVAEVWETEGQARAEHLVETANRGSDTLRFRWIAPGSADPALSARELDAVRAGGDVQRVQPGDPSEELVSYFAVRPGVAQLGILELRESLAERDQHTRATVRASLVAVVVITTVFLLLAMIIGRWFVGRPIDELVKKARRVAAGDLSSPLDLRAAAEFRYLARELNGMCDRLAAAQNKAASEADARVRAVDQLRHADRLATIGQLAAGVAHEVGTPLSIVAGHAQMIAGREVAGEAVFESARVIDAQVHRVARIVRQLLDFARRKGPEGGTADVLAVASSAGELLTRSARNKGVGIRAVGDACQAQVDEESLRQVVTNLVMNAVHASSEGDEVLITVHRVLAVPPRGVEGDFVRTDVRDTGTGISDEVLPHIFAPFFTTRSTGEGTGLGLSVVHGIVQDHGGWIDVDSALGRGTTFSVFLPVAKASP
jgi:signal transduction histidine kinase